jgi:hypothetical protein
MFSKVVCSFGALLSKALIIVQLFAVVRNREREKRREKRLEWLYKAKLSFGAFETVPKVAFSPSLMRVRAVRGSLVSLSS